MNQKRNDANYPWPMSKHAHMDEAFLPRRPTNCAVRVLNTVVLLVLSLIFVCLCWTLYERIARDPIVISLAERPEPIWNVPFPAITICPEVKSKGHILNITDIYHRLFEDTGDVPADIQKKMSAVLQLCDTHLLNSKISNQLEADADLLETLNEISPQEPNVFFAIKRNGKLENNLFADVWTKEGHCFTYNTLNSKELYSSEMASNFPPIQQNSAEEHWKSHTGYTSRHNLTFPFRAHSSGIRGSLIAVLTQSYDDLDYLCRGPMLGFKVTVHSPDEMPQVANHFVRITPGHETHLTVRPVVRDADASLERSLNADERGCYVAGERPLRFFRSYTQGNCEQECLSEHVMRTCNCTGFAMPRDNQMPVCGLSKMECMDQAQAELLDRNALDGLTAERSDCVCLPACTAIEYDFDASHSEMNWKDVFAAFKAPQLPGTTMSRLTVMFKESHYTPTKRYYLYGNAERAALFGALVALFFGVSLLGVSQWISTKLLRRFGWLDDNAPHQIVEMDGV